MSSLILVKKGRIEPDSSFVLTYTYDGELDPGDFPNWELLTVGQDRMGYYHIWLINPDENADIQAVETLNILTDEPRYIIIAYKYYKNNVLYVFNLDFDRLHYDQVEPELGSEPSDNIIVKYF